MANPVIQTLVFDLGGVLIDWNPRHLYRKMFQDSEEMEWFLAHVCTSDWNEMQDAGRPFETAVAQLIPQFPEYEAEIRAFWERWPEMLGGAIEEMVAFQQAAIHDSPYRVYALTNWSSQTFPVARQQFSFLADFEGILVSGEEKVIKPDRRIYERLAERFDIDPASALFIDDNLRNVLGAREAGWQALHFRDFEAFKQDLPAYGVPLLTEA